MKEVIRFEETFHDYGNIKFTIEDDNPQQLLNTLKRLLFSLECAVERVQRSIPE